MGRQLKIALFYNVDTGGAKRVIYEHAKALFEKGHRIDIYTLTDLKEDFLSSEPFANERFKFEYRWFNPTLQLTGLTEYIKFFSKLINLFRLKRVSRKAAKRIDQGGYDFIYVHKCRYTFSPYVLRYLKNTPSIFFCQEPPREIYEPHPPRAYRDHKNFRLRLWNLYYGPINWLWEKVLKEADRRNVQSASLLLANSYYSREAFFKVYWASAKVCYLGVDLERFRPDPSASKENMVISVGGYTSVKGFDFLIEALSLIEQPKRPRLVIVGDRTYLPEKQYLEGLAKEKTVGYQFLERASEEELVKQYNKARLLVYTPIMEPFGLVVLEAMACGLPVVGVKEGGLRESIVDGETGLLVDRDKREFAKAVERLLSDKDLSSRLGENGRRQVQEKWTWQKSIEGLERIIQDFLGTFHTAHRGGVELG